MKKIFIIHINRSFWALGILLLIINGCKKVNTSSDLSTPRLFKPGGLTVSTGQTVAKVTWTTPLFSTSSQKLSYTAAFSKDSLFATTEFTLTTDTTGVTATDDKLAVRQKYYVRVKANAYADQPESKWIESSSFSISGTQLFKTIRDLEIKETSVTLRFTPTVGLTKITITPLSGGQPVDVALSAADAAAGLKVITGLTAATKYSAELFDTKSKGYVTFTTLVATIYSVVLNSGADIAATIAAAANNAIIGLNPGTYNLTTVATPILNKTITLKSTSGNPSDTKVNFKEFTIRGTGAGINLSGIEFDGTAGAALYFLNFTGAVADAEQATYTQIVAENCIIHAATTSLLRANRGTNVGDYKIDQMSFKNCLVYDIGSTLAYFCFHLDKLQFNTLSVTNSTFYNVGIGLITAATTLTSTAPTINFDACTLNNFGAASKYPILDANANPVKFNMTNSIIANIPRPSGAVQSVAIRASAATSSMVFNNNNTFNLTNGSGVALTFPTSNFTQSGAQTINLGWTTSTTDFTLPANSPLRTASNVSAAIGDPRWTY